uniref:Uncharacterized protein n=1 Tax=Anguilla anguilla TaxID=7936 RepID=A0A0E9SJY7_ANGAN
MYPLCVCALRMVCLHIMAYFKIYLFFNLASPIPPEFGMSNSQNNC